jgi:hypothetical protein
MPCSTSLLACNALNPVAKRVAKKHCRQIGVFLTNVASAAAAAAAAATATAAAYAMITLLLIDSCYSDVCVQAEPGTNVSKHNDFCEPLFQQ